MITRGRILLVLLVLVAVLTGSGRAEPGVKTVSSTVTYLSGKDTVSAYLTVPEGDGPFPAVMVIHEWWGLNGWIREMSRELAAEGYVTLAIDLYRGTVAETADDAHQLMRGIPEDRARRDLAAAFGFLKGRKDVNPEKIGSLGWCMGGGYSLEAAVTLPGISATVVCYGRLVTDTTAIAGIRASLLGIFGEQDKGIPAPSVRDFEKTSKELGRDIDITIYPDAGHAFMNPNNAGGYNEKDAKDAWNRITGFFRKKFR